MRSRRFSILSFSAFMSLGTGCGSEPTEQLPSKVSKLVRAAEGGSFEVDETDSLPLAGTKLEVPTGALTADTMITVALSTDLTQGNSPAVDFGPDGTHFSKPVRITLPYSGSSRRAQILWVSGHDSSAVKPANVVVDLNTKRVSFEIDHFTVFQADEVEGACASNDDCAPGQNCQDSVCMDVCDCGLPPPTVPSHECPDGSVGGWTGQCLQFAEGCHWEIRECPACTTASDCGSDQTCESGSCVADQGCRREDCGPVPPSLPTYTCVDGSTGGFTGQCVEGTDGACGWEIVECEPGCASNADCDSGEECVEGSCQVADCDVSECGPRPGMPNYLCSDGSTGGPTGQCTRIEGSCGWEIRTCDPTPTCGGDGQPPCLSAGDVCEGDGVCGAGLSCCYPCGIQGCQNVCEPTCDPSTPGCAGGCMLRP